MRLAQSIDMKECLIPNSNPIRPEAFHDTPNHILSSTEYALQEDLNDLVHYAENHEMKINTM